VCPVEAFDVQQNFWDRQLVSSSLGPSAYEERVLRSVAISGLGFPFHRGSDIQDDMGSMVFVGMAGAGMTWEISTKNIQQWRIFTESFDGFLYGFMGQDMSRMTVLAIFTMRKNSCGLLGLDTLCDLSYQPLEIVCIGV
jgi:hypothetical protein